MPTTRQLLVRSGADLGVAIAEARKARGMTQLEVAAEAGIERSYLAKMETGLTVVLLERALRVLRRLGARVIVELPAPTEIQGKGSEPDSSTGSRGRGR